MKTKLLRMAIRFVTDETYTGQFFANEYIDEWYSEDKQNLLPRDIPLLDGTLSSIFIICDAYSPYEDRLEYELDDVQLREAVKALLINNRLITGTYDESKLDPGAKIVHEFYTKDIETNPDYNPDQLKKLGNFPLDPYDFEKDLF